LSEEPERIAFSAKEMLGVLSAILTVFRGDGADVDWLYLIRAPFEYGMDEWVLRFVSRETPDSLRLRKIRLRQEGLFPTLPLDARLDSVPPEEYEAACIADFARCADVEPIILDDFAWKGLYFDYVLVCGLAVRPLKTASPRHRMRRNAMHFPPK